MTCTSPTLRMAALAAFAALAQACASRPAAADAPFDHVVVVIMENKSYDETRVQPYTASLIAQGASFSNSHAVVHPSQPNYFALWAGSTLGVTNDNCPPTGTPFSAENLGHACQTAGKSWRAYSENLAFAGSTSCAYDGSPSTGLYTRKHDPWTNFSNIIHTFERPYFDLAGDLSANILPNLTFVIPNNCHNTHNSSTPGCGLADGDAWLAANLPPILSGMGPNGLLILTWDEDDNSMSNQILTVFVGQRVIPGVISSQPVTHYTLVRAICDALGLPPFALAATEAPITGIWQQPVAARTGTWGRLKTIYR